VRPRGEIRDAIADAARALKAEQGAATWKELAARARVGFDLGFETVRNMARSGELQTVGRVKAAGSGNWCKLYEPAEPGPQLGLDLERMLRSWRV
jgi:hypothetical protein